MSKEPDAKRQKTQIAPNEAKLPQQQDDKSLPLEVQDMSATTIACGLQKLKDTALELQSALELHTLPDVPAFCRTQPTIVGAKQVINYAHRLSYTTFAASSQTAAHFFRPPAPQDWDFRASALHALSGNTLAKQEGGIEPHAQMGQAEGVRAHDHTTDAPSSSKLESKIVQEDASVQNQGHEQTRKPVEMNSALDFMLNEDMEEVEEEFSSDEEESD